MSRAMRRSARSAWSVISARSTPVAVGEDRGADEHRDDGRQDAEHHHRDDHLDQGEAAGGRTSCHLHWTVGA
jgi:hypothetical protein